MTILFLCASLEAGRDGVGDYTHQLARACVSRGHGCTIIALHDPYVRDETDLCTQDGLRTIRLPALQTWRGRIERVASFAHQQFPQWISWQLVNYSYHPRGFFPQALDRLAARLPHPRHHVMLHELWIGLEAHAPWPQRGQGWIQRHGLLRWLRRVKPSVLHTSNPTYRHVLADAGFTATVLPLFGNMPVLAASSTLLPVHHTRLIAVIFGTVHAQWQPEATIAWLRDAGRILGCPPLLLAIGRLGDAPGALHAFRQAEIEVRVTGAQEPDVISRLIGGADFGLALHPWALIGKSGAAAVLLDHGLPVLVPRDEWRLRGSATADPADNPRLRRLADVAPAAAAAWLALRQPAQATLPRITSAFLESLAQA